jgi:hypothetical protein
MSTLVATSAYTAGVSRVVYQMAELGYLYTDMKPENVVVDESNLDTFLIDFSPDYCSKENDDVECMHACMMVLYAILCHVGGFVDHAAHAKALVLGLTVCMTSVSHYMDTKSAIGNSILHYVNKPRTHWTHLFENISNTIRD